MTKTWGRQVNEPLRDAYLTRLGLRTPPPATLDTLRELHRAQVEKIPYETVWIALGEQRTVDPLDSLRYLLRGRGGYCYHLNGAFSTLLAWLGFDVHWRVGGVQGGKGDEPGITANHLVIEVHGLDGGPWMVDAGLGDGLYDPIPLAEGVYEQAPYTFALRPSEVVPGGWRLDHDARGSFIGMDFAPAQAKVDDFLAKHDHLCTSPDSGFVRVVTVSNRDAKTIRELRGRLYKETNADGVTHTEIADRGDYFGLLGDVFGLPLPEIGADRRDALWARLCVDHEQYVAGKGARRRAAQ
ncbi:arylamine N-acetyltransferase family protein [Actinokineospora xionganensis]|uniref:Arylamine N-acetyltransferase n=1 Tax=Actinokineospora xionganensis TaxID=2684470 RepID=A0ABR7L1A0_9PSEU|nr:arylamine N-acetyltransferase [Actinokineospora xionganensis]MBC6446462.1 arylamine N-acetyltransferase [Actinokineospora xionganensis]